MFLWLGYTILLAILCYIAFDKYVRKWFKKTCCNKICIYCDISDKYIHIDM